MKAATAPSTDQLPLSPESVLRRCAELWNEELRGVRLVMRCEGLTGGKERWSVLVECTAGDLSVRERFLKGIALPLPKRSVFGAGDSIENAIIDLVEKLDTLHRVLGDLDSLT